MLAWHVLISPHFSWNHGRGGWLGPGGGEEQDEDEVKFIDTDEVKWRHARGMTQSPTGCMLPEVRQHAEEMGKMYEKETKSLWHYLFLSSSSFKQLIIEDPLRQHDDKNRMLRFLSYCSSMTDRRACWIWENLQSGTKRTNVWYESCWHIFTVKSSWVLHTWSVAGMDWYKTDGSSGQAIIFAPVRSIILLPISESFHSMLVYLKMHGLLLWDKPTTWYTHFA